MYPYDDYEREPDERGWLFRFFDGIGLGVVIFVALAIVCIIDIYDDVKLFFISNKTK